MTTVRTQNWESMMEFYCRVLGMEADNNDFKHIVSLKGLNTEIRLERVDDEADQEVIGRLDLETNEAGLSHFLSNRNSLPFELRSGKNFELVFRDPDNNSVYIAQEVISAQAA